MSDDMFISAYHGGLGDNLQFSTLPEMFSKQGKKVYVWSQSYFRNQEIFDLVWGKNPYILGIKDGEWNAGDAPVIGHKNITGNCISNWEILHGLEPTNLYPKIYYTPSKIEGLENTMLVDLSSISTVYDNEISEHVKKFQLENPNLTFRYVRFMKNLNPPKRSPIAHDGVFRQYSAELSEFVDIYNIFQYCDVMFSSHGIISLHNGASHLSSAIKEYAPDLKSICLIPHEQYENNKNRALFVFDNVEYIMV
jgi:hypothetical protein